MRRVVMPTAIEGAIVSRYLQSLKSQMIIFLHQLESRNNGPVLLFEILVIIVGIDTVSCLLLQRWTWIQT